MFRILAVSMFAAVAAVSLHAQSRAMTFEDVIAMKGVSDAQISPDGKWVAYVVTSADMKENAPDADVWLAPASAGQPIRLTTSRKSDNQPRWSPDGKRLAFLSAREDKDQIFVISPFGGEAEKLTDSKAAVQSYAWSPDGRRIAYVSPRELTSDEEQKEKDKDDASVVDQNHRFGRLWLIDVETKKRTELVKDDSMPSDPQWSPDGQSIAYTVVPTPKADDGSLADIWIVDVASGRTRKLVDNPGPDRSPRWSPDGQQIAYIAVTAQPAVIRQNTLRIVAASGGSSREVLREFTYEPDAPQWLPDGRTLVFTAPVRTTTQLFRVAAAGGVPEQISKVEGVMGGGFTKSKDATTIAFTLNTIQRPSDVHVSQLAAFKPEKISDHNPQVAQFQLGRGDVIRWRSKDNMEIEGILLYPTGYESGKRYPTIAMIHGGPSGVWNQAFAGSWANAGQVWAANGWVVFYPNIRGSSAYGEKFLLANVGDWGGGDFQDIQTGLDALIARGIADPARLAQSGWSYGGYMTAWTLTQTNRFKAVMVGAGLTNMFSMYSTNDLQRVLDGYFGGEPWNGVETYRARSAMTFIKQARTPTLIQHGAQDLRVPVGQAQELYMGLKKNNVPVELVFYPREPHGLREPRHQLDKMKREFAWMTKYVLAPKPVSQD